MKQTSAIIKTLKKYLRAKRITYQHLAQEMGLSESSIKRLFAKESFSVSRMEKICKIVGIDFWDLALMVRKDGFRKENILTYDQERILADDQRLLVFFYFLVNGWPLPYILEEYDISELEVSRLLIKLDGMRLIELHPNNRIRLLVTKNVFWQQNGPLWKRLRGIIEDSFFNYSFDAPNERLLFSIGQFSQDSIRILLKKMDEYFKQFNELAEMDVSLPIPERRSTAIFISFRPWLFPGGGLSKKKRSHLKSKKTTGEK